MNFFHLVLYAGCTPLLYYVLLFIMLKFVPFNFFCVQVSILLLTPLFSKILLLLQLQPQEFVTGFTATQAFRMYTTHICLLIRVWP